MKINPDKHTKSVSLAIALERYQSSPRFNRHFQQESHVSPQEIKFTPTALRYEHNAESLNSNEIFLNNQIHKQRQKGRQRSLQRRVKAKQAKEDVSEDEDELFNQCSNLASRVEALKIEKYENAIQQFEQQQQKKMYYVLNLEQNSIRLKYSQLRKDLQTIFQQQKSKILKNLEEVNKFKSAYQAMNQQLSDKKIKIDREYRDSIAKTKQNKQKLILQWKRSSNEQILKLGLKNMSP